MGISTTTNRASYNGDGTSAVFAFGYEFHAQADLKVYVWNSSRTVASASKTLNVDYTIAGTADAQNRYTAGGNVVFNSTPAATDYIIIYRDAQATNPFSLMFGQVIPSAELVKELDRITIVEQRLNDLTSRSVRLHDAFPLTFSPTMPDRLVAGGALIVGSSGQTIEMGVVAVAGSTAATYFGILPTNNGGTGLDFSLLTGVVYSPGNNTTFQQIANGAAGQLLTSNGAGVAPSMQSLATTLIGSGIIKVDFGGTGTGTSYILNGVVFASSATQMANTAAGGTDQPLMGNTGAAPSFKPLNVASNSSVTGIMAQATGGTGSASSFAVGAVVYQSGAGSLGAVAPGVSGTVLASQGAGNPPAYVSASGVKVNTFISDLSAETLTNLTDAAYLSGPSGTLELYTTAGANQGKEVTVVHQGSNFVQYTVQAATSQWFVLADGSFNRNFPMFTYSEMVRFSMAGSSLLITGRNASGQGSFIPAVEGVTVSTEPAKVSGVWTRRNNWMKFDWALTGSTAAAVIMSIMMPGTSSIDSAILSLGSSQTNHHFIGHYAWAGNGNNGFMTAVTNSSLLRVYFGGATGGSSPFIPQTASALLGNAQAGRGTVEGPILNWQP